MSNRWLRFVIALLALAAAGGAGYRVLQQEQLLAREVAKTDSADRSAESALLAAADLKAALNAYVAAGQGQPFWTARASQLLERLRASVLELDGAATDAGASIADALAAVDRLAAAEERARAHVADNQPLLAGELIFTDVRDLLDAVRVEIAETRQQIAATNGARQADVRREALYLILAAAGVLALAVIILVPPGRSAPRVEPPPETTVDETPSSAASRAQVAEPVSEDPADVLHPLPEPAPPEVAAADASPSSAARLGEAAALCTDLARASEASEITGLLSRASAVLNASGIIVWLAAPDRQSLFPAAASGYPEELFARIGSIPREATNLTAEAFRESSSRTSRRRSAAAAAALAVPLLTPQGAVGVFSAELRNLVEVDPQQLALARIFAAQLSTLLGSITVEATAPPAPKHAQA